MKIELVFESYENAPKTGESFIAVLPGPNIDIVWFDKEENCFKDYYFKQKINYLICWSKLPNISECYNIFGIGKPGENI